MMKILGKPDCYESRRIFNIKEGWLMVTLCLVVVFSLVAGGFITGCAPPEDKSSTMTFTLHSEEYTITKDEEGYDVIEMQEFSPSTSPGDPMLPHKVYNIAVPTNIVWSSLQLDIVSAETYVLEEIYDIKPAPPFIPVAEGDDDELKEEWGEGKDIVNGKNMKVYGIDANFPESYLELLPYSQMRKWEFTKVDFTPFQYNPVSKELTLIQSVTIKISYDRSGAELDASLMSDEVMDDVASQILFNYEAAKPWYKAESEIKGKQQYDYVIITTFYIRDCAIMGLTAFKAHKQNQGHSVLIITEQQWDVPGAQAPDQKAERIREWLKNNWSSMGIKYVLLIGDPTPVESGPKYDELSIPMKMCWPCGYGSNNETAQAPTDYFYADLTGDWDVDGADMNGNLDGPNGYYGEWYDYYQQNGGVDFYPEVYVGRIPVYVYDWDYGPPYPEVDEILFKIIDYETATDISWRKSALLPMSHNWDYVGEKMTNDYLTPASFSSWRQYQQPESCDDTILHYDGTSWSIMISNTNKSTVSFGCGYGPDDVFAVGTGSAISHYDGTSWTTTNIAAIKSLNDVWGTVSMRQVNPATTGVTVPVWVFWPDVFAVGENAAGRGTVLHYDGNAWTTNMTITAYQRFYSVWGILSEHWEEYTVTKENGDIEVIRVQVFSPDVFVVGGGGIIFHYDGISWTSMTSGTRESLYGVWGNGPNDVFAVGAGGTILHYDDVNGWTSMTSGTGAQLNDVWGSGPNDIFAVGAGGTILYYDDVNGWTSMTSPTNKSLNDVWGSGPDDVFAVGAGGTILHYDDVNGWTFMDSPTGRDLYGVWGTYSDDVFAGSEWCFQTSYFPDENLKGNTVVLDRWASNDYGIVCWMGHGGPEYAYIGYNPNCWDGIIFGWDYCPSLDDEHPAFVYQGSCDNGWPEDPNNLQYSILKHGGIGTVAATRVARWGLDSIGYYYVKKLVSGVPAGEALYITKSELAPYNGAFSNFEVFNLYGDPSTSIGSSVGFLVINTSAGNAGLNQKKLEAEQEGLAIAITLLVSPTSTEFLSEVSQLVNKKVDIIWIIATSDIRDAIEATAQQLGFKGEFRFTQV